MKERFKSLVSANLILEQNNQILMSKRHNTGYYDGYYSLVGGHVESQETIRQTMTREAEEEIGIILEPDNLTIIHVMHHNSNGREFVHFFIHCSEWSGTISNREPNKCSDLQFFAKQELPTNTVPCIRYAVASIINNHFYSEFEWINQNNPIVNLDSIRI